MWFFFMALVYVSFRGSFLEYSPRILGAVAVMFSAIMYVHISSLWSTCLLAVHEMNHFDTLSVQVYYRRPLHIPFIPRFQCNGFHPNTARLLIIRCIISYSMGHPNRLYFRCIMDLHLFTSLLSSIEITQKYDGYATSFRS